MTPLSRLEALEKAATPGPWLPLKDGDVVVICTDDSLGEVVPWHEGAAQVSDADAALIAESRNLLPALIEVAKAAQQWRREKDGFRHGMHDAPARIEFALDELAAALALLDEGDAR